MAVAKSSGEKYHGHTMSYHTITQNCEPDVYEGNPFPNDLNV